MEAAQELQQGKGTESAAATPPAQLPGELASTPLTQQAEAPRHLTAVPPPHEAPLDAEAPRAPRRAAPKAAAVTAPAPAAELREERPTVAQEGKQPTHDMVRRYRERWNKATTPAEKAEAMRYGLERGVPEAVELARLFRQEGAATAPAAAPAPAQAPHAPQPTQAQPSAQPPPGAQPGAAAPAGPAAVPPPPPEPRIHGLPREAVASQANYAKWVGDVLEGLARRQGWYAPESEPLNLFEGLPGVEPIKATGNVKKQLAELLAVELASAATSAGGEAPSPLRRRMELGMLVAGFAGPGLFPFAFGVAKQGLGAMKGVLGAARGVIGRLRR